MKKTLKSILNFFTKFFKQYEISWLDYPIILQYENKTNEDKTAIIFGFNDYSNADGFGNKGIKVTNLQIGVGNPLSYARTINQSTNKPFKIGKIRVQSKVLFDKYKDLVLTYKKNDANGMEYTIPYRVYYGYYDVTKVQYDFIDMNFMSEGRKISIDGSTYFEFKLLAFTELVFSIFPIKSLNCGYFSINKNLKMHENSVVKPITKNK
jgi:hypothetical protein